MAEGYILMAGAKSLAYIYEGERIAVEYPNGDLFEVPKNKVHMMLSKAKRDNGEECYVLLPKSPITRLELVVLEDNYQQKVAIS